MILAKIAFITTVAYAAVKFIVPFRKAVLDELTYGKVEKADRFISWLLAIALTVVGAMAVFGLGSISWALVQWVIA